MIEIVELSKTEGAYSAERVIPAPVGALRLVATNGALTEVTFLDEDVATDTGDDRQPHPVAKPGNGSQNATDINQHLLDQATEQLNHYFAGQRQEFDLPVALNGTPFQVRVWKALLNVPYGSQCSYQFIATAIGQPGAVRAVGNANGANRIAIVVPCHRVIQKGGDIGGYAGGIRRKQLLTALESPARTACLF